MKALQVTLKFETKISDEMKKKYEVYLQENKQLHNLSESQQQFAISSLPKFKGSISDSFEPYLRPYVDYEEKDLRDAITKAC